MGSKRRNIFDNGTSVVEEVTEWTLGENFTVALSDMDAMPLHEASSQVTWTFDYRVKYGPLGWLLGQAMMKWMMGRIIDGNLQGLADRVKSNLKAL